MMEHAEEMFEDQTDPKSKHKEELAGLMHIEEVHGQQLDDLDDANYEKGVVKEEIPVGNGTAPGLANMLGELSVQFFAC